MDKTKKTWWHTVGVVVIVVVALIAIGLSRSLWIQTNGHPFSPLVPIYVVTMIVYLMTQFTLAVINWRVQKREEPEQYEIMEELIERKKFPKISVIFPIYNEEPEILRRVLEHAVFCLTIPGLEIIIIDDGSKNRDAVNPIYNQFEKRYKKSQLRIVRARDNRGKREVMCKGFELAKGELILTSDSDTLIYPDGVMKLVAPMIADPRVGAVTGDVRVINGHESWLARLIALRYWIAFNVERSAQSLSGSVMCCSGPFTVYRKKTIDKVKKAFIGQQFLGSPCTYGDDRHLTWLVMKEGYLIRMQSDAIAHTWAPLTLAAYIPQQTRWTKSFVRELFWVIPGAKHVSFYSLFDTIYQPLISVLFVFAFSHAFFIFFETHDGYILVGEVVMLLIMASLRSVYGFFRTKWRSFIIFPIYGLIHVFIILSLRWKAIITLADSQWGTRVANKKHSMSEFLPWSAFFMGTIVCSGIFMSLIVPDEAVAGIEQLAQLSTMELIVHFGGRLWDWLIISALIACVLIPTFFILSRLRMKYHRFGRAVVWRD